MLIKEYRIPLPMTVEEYRIAQLYMIAKKSREESKGTESGVEILVNEPYTDGPGGNGQFTHKIYHVGSHLPGWFKSLLPKSALTVEEEAWNAYPYTKTRFKCPFVEKFSLEIETYYTPDGGHQENVFNLSESEKRNRIVDLIDVVRDQEGTAFEDAEKEDPTVYISQKTGRGPLADDWIDEHWSDCESKTQPTPSGRSIMCAYKLCKVEFRYWGMQSKIERFIHDVALRKTMLKAHSQAWVWQDEWYGLSMEDIRSIERETAEMLKKTMHGGGEDGEGGYQPGYDIEATEAMNGSTNKVLGGGTGEDANPAASEMRATFNSIEYSDADVPNIIPKGTEMLKRRSICGPLEAEESLLKAISREDHKKEDNSNNEVGDEDDEFYDAKENWDDSSSLAKWSSMELENADLEAGASGRSSAASMPPGRLLDDDLVSFRRVQSLHEKSTSSPVVVEPPPHSARPLFSGGRPIIDIAECGSQDVYCPTSVLIMVVHGGSVLDGPLEASVRKSDVTTFRGAFESIVRSHYPSLVGHVVIKCVPCPAVCTEALAVLSSLSPYSFDVIPAANNGNDDFGVSNDRLPVGTIPLFATSSPEYQASINKMVSTANRVFADFLKSEDGLGFCGQVCLIGDSMGAILAYDCLCRNPVKRSSSDGSVAEADLTGTRYRSSSGGDTAPPSPNITTTEGAECDSSQACGGGGGGSRAHLSTPGHRKDQQYNCVNSSSSEGVDITRFDFDVADFFAFGSPLGLLLAYRKVQQSRSQGSTRPQIPRPAIQQLYNLFHPTDPIACRVEPLLSAPFSRVPPVNVSRYQKYPMGDGACYSLIEFIQTNTGLFSEGGMGPIGHNSGRPNQGMSRRLSEESIQSGVVDAQQLHTIHVLKPKWWGSRRLDYALYCPEGLAHFPTNCLPHLFHSSYWESADVISFVLRQLVRCYDGGLPGQGPGGLTVTHNELSIFTPNQPREKWMKKRTSVKIRNGAANHRANDVIVKEGNPQVLAARFSYGPLDMAALTGERVDVHLMKEPVAGDWVYISTEVTDKHGRLTFRMPLEHTVGYGLYPVRMVVRGDHTCLHMTLAVVPPRTETVVFSIDGSFAASVSVTGRDPKVKPGAVDIVRHWQELGYLILYVTGRPDMQLQRVVAWLTQHNFPRGLVSFADGFTTDPLRHKAETLKGLVGDQDIVIHCAYGSSKDITVYSSLGLTPEQIYVVGKPSRRQAGLGCSWLTDGYAEHLARLSAPGGSRPAQGNARMVIPKGGLGPPGLPGLQRRRTFKAASRTTSYPLGGDGQSTTQQQQPNTNAREGVTQ